VASPYGDFAFTNLPYVTDMGASCGANYVNAGTAGALDGVTIVEGHEYAETISDQNPAGGWTDAAGYENADKCAWNGVGGTGGAPAGVSGAFSPTSVNAGASSTLTLTVGSGTVAGSYTLTVTGTGSSATHATTVTLTVTPVNDFSISASPSSVNAVQGTQTQ